MPKGRIIKLKNNYGIIDTDAFKTENEWIPFKVEARMLEEKDGKQYIPESAIEVIQKSRKKGNMIFLCTGRSQAEIGDIMDIGFDGVIGAAGGYILYKNQLIITILAHLCDLHHHFAILQ